MKNIFFVNPMAGKGKEQKKVIASIKEYFAKDDGDYEIIVTKNKGYAEKVSREYAQSGGRFNMFACGGEGTGYEVINGIYGFKNVSYGIIPCGSANDFVRGLGDISHFRDISAQVNGSVVPVDLIKANDRYCINSCSVGMDAMVARDMGIFKRLPFVSGSLAYNLAIVKTFLKKFGVKIRLQIDDGELNNENCLFAVIANGAYYGGGYMGAPDAVPFDNKLNFTKVDVISKLAVLGFLGKYKSGKHDSIECCKHTDCEKMYFESDYKLPVNLDGEIVETDRMSFSIVKNGLNFIMPNTLPIDLKWKNKVGATAK
ncbi:MAG: YegS/Rv2252/BmrU family lipid kinase [Ruminococcaceae bacterium]|nr:YegS/Rv2252/BmrU family lipid kinase [Oscillospiraceae bacterium]